MKRIIGILLVLAFALGGLSAVSFAEDCPHGDTTWVKLNGRGCALYCNDCWEFLTEEQPHQYGEDGFCTRCSLAAKPWRADLTEPVIQVTTDKDSYDLYNKMTVTVTVTNPEEVASWWPKETWRNPEEWLVGGEYSFQTFRLCASDGGQQFARFTVEEVTDYSMTLTLEGLFVVTPEEYPEMIGDVLFEVDIVLMNNYDMRLYCPVPIHYTGACIPCEGEHSFGDWKFAFGVYYPEVGEDGGHVRICETCGYRELKDEPCTLETKKDYFVKDGTPTGCYEEYQTCTVCHYCPFSQEHHTDLHTITGGFEPTCTEWGAKHTWQYCDACEQDVYENSDFQELPPLGHDLQDGICTRCLKTFSQLDCVATLTLDKTEAGDGEAITAVYTLKDAQNAPIEGAELVVYCTAYPGYEYSALAWIATDENGTATLCIRPYTMFGAYEGTPAGEHFVTVRCHGYNDSTATASFTFTGTETEEGPASVTLEADKKLIGPYEETEDVITFTVGAEDGTGAPVASAMVGFEIKDLKGQTVDGPYWWITDENGLCHLNFRFARDEIPAGSYVMEITCGDRVLRQNFDFISPSAFTPGDPDGDGKVTSTDARLALQVSVGKLQSGDVAFPEAMDVDGDNSITSTDARLILQKSVGKIKDWP